MTESINVCAGSICDTAMLFIVAVFVGSRGSDRRIY
jgi:hypothetical protein